MSIQTRTSTHAATGDGRSSMARGGDVHAQWKRKRASSWYSIIPGRVSAMTEACAAEETHAT